MAFGYKILGQSAPADTNNADLYTVPASTEVIISSLTVANVTGSETSYRIFIRDGGAAAAVTNALTFDAKVAGNSTTVISSGITLSAGDVISVRSSIANAITFMAFGTEVTI